MKLNVKLILPQNSQCLSPLFFFVHFRTICSLTFGFFSEYEILKIQDLRISSREDLSVGFGKFFFETGKPNVKGNFSWKYKIIVHSVWLDKTNSWNLFLTPIFKNKSFFFYWQQSEKVFVLLFYFSKTFGINVTLFQLFSWKR